MIVSRMIGIRVLYVKVGVYGTAVVTAITGSAEGGEGEGEGAVTASGSIPTVTSSCVIVAGVPDTCGERGGEEERGWEEEREGVTSSSGSDNTP